MVRFSRIGLAAVPMCHPQVIRSLKLRRHDGGNALKSQDNCEELRALPLNWVECANLNTCRGLRVSLPPKLQSRGAGETWQEAVTTPEALVAIDLFCGAGGLSYGFQEAGFVCALGIDRDADACETHAANLFSRTRLSGYSDDYASPEVDGGAGYSSGRCHYRRTALPGLFPGWPWEGTEFKQRDSGQDIQTKLSVPRICPVRSSAATPVLCHGKCPASEFVR